MPILPANGGPTLGVRLGSLSFCKQPSLLNGQSALQIPVAIMAQ